MKMIREIDYVITKQDSGKTVARLLKEKGYSEKLITSFRKDKKALTINKEQVYTIYKLNEGETLHVRIEEPGSENVKAVKPDKMPEIVYEDEDILVVNKPACMPVHPSMEHYEDTLGNAIMWHFKEAGYEQVTFRIINRLDKDTSGLTLIAKNRLSAGILSEAMVNREIHRTYLALCDGKVEESGVINKKIARASGSVLLRCVDEKNGERAVTHFETISYDVALDASLVRLWLETGRTHQIRVHMKSIGHPLLGDFLYNPMDRRREHQALHSYRLEFIHPVTGKKMDFCCDAQW